MVWLTYQRVIETAHEQNYYLLTIVKMNSEKQWYVFHYFSVFLYQYKFVFSSLGYATGRTVRKAVERDRASLRFSKRIRKTHLLGVAPNPPTDSRFVGYFKGFFADSTSSKKALQCMKLRLYCYPNNLLKSLLSFLSLWASSFFARLQ